VAPKSAAPVATLPPTALVVVFRIVAAVLAYEVTLAIGTVALFFAGLSFLPGQAQGPFSLIGLGIAEGAGLGVVLLVWRWLDHRPIRELGLDRSRPGWRWLKGAAIATLMMGFVALAWYTLVDGATWDSNPDAARAALVLVVGLLGLAIQGPAEEVLFRGYILDNVRSRFGWRWAVVASSLCFGLLHAPNPGFGPLPFVNLVLFGVATALYRLRIDDGQLWGVFGIHSVWNWLEQVVFGLPNSGVTSVPDNALFTITPNQSLPDFVWGGGFGPEGTLATSLVLLALIGAILRRPDRSTTS
jgi:uncharacterized protein